MVYNTHMKGLKVAITSSKIKVGLLLFNGAMPRKNMIRKSILFKEEMVEMIKKIQNKNALPSFTAAIHFAVAAMYAKDNPAYMALKVNESPMERAQRKAQEKKAKEEIIRAEQIGILKSLGGELVVKEGRDTARYYTYSGRKRFMQEVSLSMLSEDLVKTQYQPSKAKVEELQKEGKVDY